ncbi:MAG TPA: RelA/SpoT family protein, partial [Wenzhouxiangella sp.]|nr:RelA/SpoT family protein [Wenzhouxiangella sp.]
MLPAQVLVLRDLLNTYLEPQHVATVLRAYETGALAHAGQKRRSGEDYITHPVEVARILARLRMDHETIVAAILHDTIEDTELKRQDLVDQFGQEVADLVEGVTKLDKMKFSTRRQADAESFRKLLLAMSRDLRVIFIKLADRLHNMRTIEHMSQSARRRISAETLEIYAPIAARLGMSELREELEDLGFRHRYPNRYRVLSAHLRRRMGRRGSALETVVDSLRKRLNEAGLAAEVEGRTKTLYSIYSKMRERSLPLAQLMDLYAVRIITQTQPECYQALGVVHTLYQPIMGSFKDYIAVPKPNGYQSLHTVVNARLALPVEVQIRTQRMDMTAKRGAAAHWIYKSLADDETMERGRRWLYKLVDTEGREKTDSEKFIASAKAELYPDEVFVFTPNGRIIDLKRHSTALDFAYAIHTQVGDQAVAAYIDNEQMPLYTELQSGQTVRIETREGEKPKPEWHEFVVTSKARSSIRAHLKNLERADSVEFGNRLL